MTKWVIAGLAFGLLALEAPVSAQTAQPAPKGLEEAKALTQKAEVDYKLGHFEASLSEYGSAYEKYPTPALLLNIGQCHRMLKNYEQAIFFYKGYLRDKPDAPNRSAIEALIDESTKNLEAQRAEAAAKEQQKRQAEEQARAALPPPAPVTDQAAAGTRPSPALRIAGLATAGVGVALLGTAIYFGLHASSDSSTLTGMARGTPWTGGDQSIYDNGKSSAQIATALYVAGGVTLAAGGVLTWLGWPKKAAESPPAASVVPVPGGAAMMVRGMF
jgi:tetratricopeptide (TPR) repeat protein